MPPARPRVVLRLRQIVEHREGSDPLIRKLPGSSEWLEIEVKRGVDGNLTLWSWRDQAMRQGPSAARLDGKIELFDGTGATIATYQFTQGWPARYELQAADGAVVESLTIVHEALQRV